MYSIRLANGFQLIGKGTSSSNNKDAVWFHKFFCFY